MNEEETNYYPPVMNSGDAKADLLERIRPSDIVEEVRQKLLGKEFINGKWVAQPHLQPKALTEVGAWELSTLMLPASSQNVSISNLSDREIKIRTLELVKSAMILALQNWKEYGIQGADQIYLIREIIHTNSWVTLKQPESEGIRKLLKGTTSEVRSINDSSPQKKGILGRFVRK